MFDLAVIGSGMAGMAASLYAANRGLSVVQIGNVGGTLFATGLFDLLAVHPMAEGKIWQDPWLAMDALKKDIPEHPYRNLGRDEIEAAFKELIDFFNSGGLPYHMDPSKNCEVITSMGTIKHTFAVPDSMWPGVQAYERKSPTLLVDFAGLREYSAKQIVAGLGHLWPGLKSHTISFPGREKQVELYTAHLAQDLELAAVRVELAERIKNEIGEAKAVGFPAVLGLKRTTQICAHLGELLRVPVFEIPTMPTSVPGLRLKLFFDTHLPALKVTRIIDKRVEKAFPSAEGFTLNTGEGDSPNQVHCRRVILATGRFMGKGLRADRTRVRETVFDLPVCQPAKREDWHAENFGAAAGHQINRAGVETDGEFRPLGPGGKVFNNNLYAAGSILAHQDWVRMKCGTGLAIATSYKAVESCCEGVKGSNGSRRNSG